MDRIRNEQIRGTVNVEQFGDEVKEERWRRFGHVLRTESEDTGQRMSGKRRR